VSEFVNAMSWLGWHPLSPFFAAYDRSLGGEGTVLLACESNDPHANFSFSQAICFSVHGDN